MRYGKIRCAGQGGADQPHCGQPTCPICYTFGYITKNKQGDEQNAHSGVVNVTDAHILLFPVHSVAGPVWISTPQRLREAGFENVQPKSVPDEQIYLTWNHPNRLNLGWLMLDVAPSATFTLPQKTQKNWENWSSDPRWTAVQKRIALVSDGIFSQIVNSNLEVRTSVSIDSRTGAAADKALFTYEALPRATWLWLDVVEDDYRKGFPASDQKAQQFQHKHPLDVVRAGLELAEYLGIGGMGTRGFGRIRIVGNPLKINPLEQKAAPNNKQQEATQ
jgi:CRISPR-associated protein Cmr4